MMINGLDLLFLEVNSLEVSLEFYQRQLGLDLQRCDFESEPPMATLRAGSLRITLAQNLETMLRRGRGIHLFMGVQDVDLFYETLTERGVYLAPPADEGWGGRFITIEDPDKYRLFFVSWSNGEGKALDVWHASVCL